MSRLCRARFQVGIKSCKPYVALLCFDEWNTECCLDGLCSALRDFLLLLRCTLRRGFCYAFLLQ